MADCSSTEEVEYLLCDDVNYNFPVGDIGEVFDSPPFSRESVRVYVDDTSEVKRSLCGEVSKIIVVANCECLKIGMLCITGMEITYGEEQMEGKVERASCRDGSTHTVQRRCQW